MTVQNYIDSISQRYKLANSTEHTFRGDLQQLIESIVPGVRATNEPKRQSCGAPDYILTRKEIPVGYIEAKDIGDKDLDGLKKTGNKSQFDRYKNSLDNLIFTDYLDFHLYIEGNFVMKISIGELIGNQIVGTTENYARFESFIADFCTHVGQTIKSPKKLAEMMAGKARLLSDIIENALTSDEYNHEDSSLKDQMHSFKRILIHDITPKGFADVYAQTIAYGMFAARLHDPSLGNFSRQEAAELIPKSNPFLRKLFGYIAGPDLDDRIKWIVDSLADIFLHCNVEQILKNFGKSTQMEDPIIHFYETFLSAYDPQLRKSRGVWYTPQPVVQFMVRAVDEILKTEFDLLQGLADTSKTTIKVNTQNIDKRSSTGYKQFDQEVHKVQILDPATGTGTFLAEVVKHIHKKFEGQQGVWSHYVEEHLLPRLNGFEILMASYAMAHLKLELLLKETGHEQKSNQRMRVFLTNSLEESHQDTGTLFASWLSTEASESNYIKRDTPVMCVIGNPPYSGISSNNGEWISNLIEDYKYVNGVHINERKHWLNDDYVKFLRYAQYFIEKNGSGVIAYINPHGFLDNPTFRGMRWNLLRTFDKIYAIDLHGNSKKKETTPDGSIDQNVFDIMQGVSINLFVKTGRKRNDNLGKVFHCDLFGRRELKYDFLANNTLKSTIFNEVIYSQPFYFFVPKSQIGRDEYERGFKVDELFTINVTGIVTARDSVVIDLDKKTLLSRIEKFIDKNLTDREIRNWLFPNKKDGKYLAGNSRGWKLEYARKKIGQNDHKSLIRDIDYRPFDIRNIYYSPDMVDWGRESVMRHFLEGTNIGLMICRQTAIDSWEHVSITKNIADDSRVSNRSKERGYILPLYIYPETNGQLTTDLLIERKSNLNIEIVKQISDNLGLSFITDHEKISEEFKIDAERKLPAEPLIRPNDWGYQNCYTPLDLLDYIYAVLHSPAYREKYKEFLKIDFPRVPYPKDQDTFWQLVNLGGELREIHLLESPVVEKYITQYPVNGDNIVTKPSFKNNRVYINTDQYFDKVPEVAWNFYIGGYQPAQKWLKDRKDRQLSFDDIMHYQKIIVALNETDRIMKLIDEIQFAV